MVLSSRGTRPFGPGSFYQLLPMGGVCLGKCEDMGCIHAPSLPTCLESADTSQMRRLSLSKTLSFYAQSEGVQSCTPSVSFLNFLDGD